jgi:aspartate aminotransferase-like enzyme
MTEMRDTKRLLINFLVMLTVGAFTLLVGNYLIGEYVTSTQKRLAIVACFAFSAWSAIKINRLANENELEILKNASDEAQKRS